MNLTRNQTNNLDARAVKAASAAKAAQAAQAAQNAASAAQVAAQNAAAMASNAASSAGSTAQAYAQGMSTQARQGVYSARSWAAPRLHSAAEYSTTAIAPRVNAALHSAASKVNPVDEARKSRSPLLTWTLLGAAVCAAVGAAAAVARWRYQTAIAADSDLAGDAAVPDEPSRPVPPANTRVPGSTGPDGRPAMSPDDPRTDTGTNSDGRVSSPGW